MLTGALLSSFKICFFEDISESTLGKTCKQFILKNLESASEVELNKTRIYFKKLTKSSSGIIVSK